MVACICLALASKAKVDLRIVCLLRACDANVERAPAEDQIPLCVGAGNTLCVLLPEISLVLCPESRLERTLCVRVENRIHESQRRINQGVALVVFRVIFFVCSHSVQGRPQLRTEAPTWTTRT